MSALTKNQATKIYFRKNGYLVENSKFDRYYCFGLVKALIQFLFDIGVFILIQMITWLVLGYGIWTSLILMLAIYWIITVSSVLLFRGRTLGMLIMGLKITAYDGGQASKGALIWRAIASSIHATPIVGQIFSFCTVLTILATRGVSPIDLLTKTIVVSKWTATKMQKIYTEYEED